MQLIVMNYGEKASMQAKKKIWIMVLKIQKSVETQQKSLASQATHTQPQKWFMKNSKWSRKSPLLVYVWCGATSNISNMYGWII